MMNESYQKPPYPARGHIYVCDLGQNPGCIQDGKRPVLVISDNDLCRNAPIVQIAPITTSLKRLDLPGHILLPEIEALHRPSMLVLEQMRTVNVSDLGYYCGMLRGNDVWNEINNGIKKVLGLWHKNYVPRSSYIRTEQSVTCLCPRCVDYYKNDPSYRVKRLTPPDGAKDECDRCGAPGFDYLITETREA